MENAQRRGTREQIIDRSKRRCERCGGRGTDYHHRRRRGIKDGHTECSCNALWLCRDCHAEVHAQPYRSRNNGWIVSVGVESPATEPVRTWRGKMRFNCQGMVVRL